MKPLVFTLALPFFFLSVICAQAPSIQWQKSLGGTGADFAISILATADGGYIVAGRTSSNDGDVSNNHGDLDFWVVKLAPTVATFNVIATTPVLSIYPNPSSGLITISLENQDSMQGFILSDMAGKIVMDVPFGELVQIIDVDLRAIPSGVYLLEVHSRERVFSEKIILH